jgi:hypothetical protein
MNFLESQGIHFHWNTHISSEKDIVETTELGEVIFAGGVQPGRSEFLNAHNVLLQGVGGCWMEIINPGFTRPFHIEDYAPVNAISCTPLIREDGQDVLLIAGADAWIGERAYDEAAEICAPLLREMEKEGHRLFGVDTSAESGDVLSRGFCVRPALPNGVPQIGFLTELETGHRVHLVIGGVGGGATQAFVAAEKIAENLD